MSLITCPACQGQVSRKVGACPHCGHPVSPVSKRRYRGVFGLAALVLLAAPAIYAYEPIAAKVLHKYAAVYGDRGSDKIESKQYAEAIADLDRAPELKPQDAAAYTVQGAAKSGLGRNAEAIADYDRARGLDLGVTSRRSPKKRRGGVGK